LKVFQQEIGGRHAQEHYQRVRTSVLGEADVVGQEGEEESTQTGNSWRELFRKEIDHWDGKGSENQRNDAKISLGGGEGIEKMCNNIEEGRVQVERIFLIKFELSMDVWP